jgi:hypothetical protein
MVWSTIPYDHMGWDDTNTTCKPPTLLVVGVIDRLVIPVNNQAPVSGGAWALSL